VDTEKYRQRLETMKAELARKTRREVETGREAVDDQPDTEDQSVVEEMRDEYFTLAQSDSDVLAQVRGALQRIEEGTFGRCVVDGGPIEEARLESVPWTPYCAKHQQQAEAAAGIRTPRA
jgi:RNA polymerase-binding transcription factor